MIRDDGRDWLISALRALARVGQEAPTYREELPCSATREEKPQRAPFRFSPRALAAVARTSSYALRLLAAREFIPAKPMPLREASATRPDA